MKHYHLLAGEPGCMPNMNEVYKTQEEAREAFKTELEFEFDVFELSDDDVTYNQELTYATVKGGGNPYYEITECNQDCELDN